MARRSNSYRKPKGLEEDRAVMRAIQALPGYTTLNPQSSVEALQQLEITLTEAERIEEDAFRQLDVARTRAVEAAWAFHNAVHAGKDQVIALFGRESLNLHAVGLKKRSERRRPVRRPAAGD